MKKWIIGGGIAVLLVLGIAAVASPPSYVPQSSFLYYPYRYAYDPFYSGTHYIYRSSTTYVSHSLPSHGTTYRSTSKSSTTYRSGSTTSRSTTTTRSGSGGISTFTGGTRSGGGLSGGRRK